MSKKFNTNNQFDNAGQKENLINLTELANQNVVKKNKPNFNESFIGLDANFGSRQKSIFGLSGELEDTIKPNKCRYLDKKNLQILFTEYGESIDGFDVKKYPLKVSYYKAAADNNPEEVIGCIGSKIFHIKENPAKLDIIDFTNIDGKIYPVKNIVISGKNKEKITISYINDNDKEKSADVNSEWIVQPKEKDAMKKFENVASIAKTILDISASVAKIFFTK